MNEDYTSFLILITAVASLTVGYVLGFNLGTSTSYAGAESSLPIQLSPAAAVRSSSGASKFLQPAMTAAEIASLPSDTVITVK